MMQFIEAEAIQRKLASIYLYVAKENVRVVSLYKKMGFIVIENNQPLLRMQKQLSKNVN